MLKRNFYSLGYYCTPNLSIHQNSTQELTWNFLVTLKIWWDDCHNPAPPRPKILFFPDKATFGRANWHIGPLAHGFRRPWFLFSRRPCLQKLHSFYKFEFLLSPMAYAHNAAKQNYIYYIQRRSTEPVKFLFLPERGLLGRPGSRLKFSFSILLLSLSPRSAG